MTSASDWGVIGVLRLGITRFFHLFRHCFLFFFPPLRVGSEHGGRDGDGMDTDTLGTLLCYNFYCLVSILRLEPPFCLLAFLCTLLFWFSFLHIGFNIYLFCGSFGGYGFRRTTGNTGLEVQVPVFALRRNMYLDSTRGWHACCAPTSADKVSQLRRVLSGIVLGQSTAAGVVMMLR